VVGDLGAGVRGSGRVPESGGALTGIAGPNTVLIAEGTRRVLGNLFELHDLGSRDLKGIAGPARAWAALRASTAGLARRDIPSGVQSTLNRSVSRDSAYAQSTHSKRCRNHRGAHREREAAVPQPSPTLAAEVIERTDGVPLFVE
jgi:hypothetical protein